MVLTSPVCPFWARCRLTDINVVCLGDSMLCGWIYTTPQHRSSQSSPFPRGKRAKTILATVLNPDIGASELNTKSAMGFLNTDEQKNIEGLLPVLCHGIDRTDWRICELRNLVVQILQQGLGKTDPRIGEIEGLVAHIIQQAIDKTDSRAGKLEQLVAHLDIGLRGDAQRITSIIETFGTGASPCGSPYICTER
ncbi:hypothetical protein EDD17DRAFT_1636108 [Pisolithus thermaeus]|nr:hypothetical protein EDD17DRAFT_1636108 [Pisolithus thermaeus]